MSVPENKKPSWPKRELGGPRFSCIYQRPQSELKSALPSLKARPEDTQRAGKSQFCRLPRFPLPLVIS
ncbi:MAG: hypothetical protein L6Q40_02960, partial [Azonexus sp.]|nr:hypothetical protein [Azonexus sp.]